MKQAGDLKAPPTFSVDNYMKSKKGVIESRLKELVPEEKNAYRSLFEAARYSLVNGGKRIRPILALATTETLGGREESALVPACALEMIHTYSMIHDDLPCMDNDDFRRGKPTLHKIYPAGHAVLTGDFLLTYAFQILAEAPHLSADQKIQMIHVLAKNAGGSGMISGQIMDIEAENKILSQDHLNLLHQYKTGALLKAAVLFGCIAAGAEKRVADQLEIFSGNIGLAFQIVDDILDVTASEEKHGRKLPSDVNNHKTTYVSSLGMEKSRQTADALLKSSLEILQGLPYNTSLLAGLAKFIVHRNK